MSLVVPIPLPMSAVTGKRLQSTDALMAGMGWGSVQPSPCRFAAIQEMTLEKQREVPHHFWGRGAAGKNDSASREAPLALCPKTLA